MKSVKRDLLVLTEPDIAKNIIKNVPIKPEIYWNIWEDRQLRISLKSFWFIQNYLYVIKRNVYMIGKSL